MRCTCQNLHLKISFFKIFGHLPGAKVNKLQLRETVNFRDSTTTAWSGERDAHVRHHAPPVTREDTVKAPRGRIRHGRPKEARYLKAEIKSHLKAVSSHMAQQIIVRTRPPIAW